MANTTVSDIIIRVTEIMPPNFPIRGAIGAIKESVDLIRARGKWSFFHKEDTITLVDSYATGTADVTQGSTSITGTGTTWTTAMTGRKIRIGIDPVDYTFTYVSGTSGTISPAYAYASQTGASYYIAQDRYSLASDVQAVVGFWDVSHRVELIPTDMITGQRFNNWFANTYAYPNSIFQFGRDSSGNYQIVFSPIISTACVIRYLYYKKPTVITGPSSTLDMPSELDSCVVHGALWRIMKNAGIEGWQDEKALFSELLEGRWREDRAFIKTRIELARWDDSMGVPWRWVLGRPYVSLVGA